MGRGEFDKGTLTVIWANAEMTKPPSFLMRVFLVGPPGLEPGTKGL